MKLIIQGANGRHRHWPVGKLGHLAPGERIVDYLMEPGDKEPPGQQIEFRLHRECGKIGLYEYRG